MQNLSQKISNNLARYISDKVNKSGEEFEVIRYGVFIFIHMSIAAILTIVLGILTNTLLEIIIISLIGALLKRCCGGVHSSSPNRCIVTGLVISYIFVVIGKLMNNLSTDIIYLLEILMLINSFIILYKKCPVPSKNKPLKKEETRKRLRKKAFNIYFMSVVIFILNIIFNEINLKYKFIDINYLVIYMILGLYMQTLTLTIMGSNMVLFIDKLLIKINV